MRLTLSAVLVLAIAGCATAPQRPAFVISTPFNEEEAGDLLKPGTNTIKGNAFMRQRGGGVVTCAGSEVRLVPATAYARHRMVAIYGTTEGGSSNQPVMLPEAPSAYFTNTRAARCDSSGNFLFDKVADGDFFVTTTVSWTVGNSRQGGNMMARAIVRGGETRSLVMAN